MEAGPWGYRRDGDGNGHDGGCDDDDCDDDDCDYYDEYEGEEGPVDGQLAHCELLVRRGFAFEKENELASCCGV